MGRFSRIGELFLFFFQDHRRTARYIHHNSWIRFFSRIFWTMAAFHIQLFLRLAFSNISKVNFEQSRHSHAINLWSFFQYQLEVWIWSLCHRLNKRFYRHLKVLLWILFWCCFCWSIHFTDWWTVVHSIILKSFQCLRSLFWCFNQMFQYKSMFHKVWFLSFLLIKL